MRNSCSLSSSWRNRAFRYSIAACVGAIFLKCSSRNCLNFSFITYSLALWCLMFTKNIRLYRHLVTLYHKKNILHMVYGKISIITSARTNGNPIKTHRFAPLLHKKSGGNAYVFQLFQFLFATKNVLQSKHNRIYKRSDRSSRSRRSYGANGTARRTRPCRSARSNGRHGCYGRNRPSRSSR